MLLHVFLHSDIAFSGMFDKQQNHTLLVCEHWDLICILQLFWGLRLSWFRCLWPTWAGQILLLVGLKNLHAHAPFQNHGSRGQFLFHPCAPGHESENTPFIELMLFCPSSLTGTYWKVLKGGRSSWVLSERISGSGRVLLWCASEFWLTWGIILRGKCCLSGSHCFSCPSQLCWVHTFLLLPGHWVTTGRKQDSSWQWYCWDPWVLLHSLYYKRYFSSLVSLPHSRAAHCTKCLLFPCCLCCTCSDWWGSRAKIEDTMACASISFLFLTWSDFYYM